MRFPDSSSGDFARLDAEVWLIKRMGQHGLKIEDGVTTWQSRRERIRAGIITGRLCDIVLGRNPNTGKTETYRTAFERLYSQPLEPKRGATSNHQEPSDETQQATGS